MIHDFTFYLIGKSGLVGEGSRFRIGLIPVQTPVGDWPGLGTEPHSKASGDLCLISIYMQSLRLG